ncbi:MAG: hypothetical protein MUP18_01780, partial [Desulfobacterales bacterium]|nr:hypothetical protein [Desulfobacterales bacterium]
AFPPRGRASTTPKPVMAKPGSIPIAFTKRVSPPFGFSPAFGRGVIRVDLERAFVRVSEEHDWARSKGPDVKKPPNHFPLEGVADQLTETGMFMH